jgi:hypothetical protein
MIMAIAAILAVCKFKFFNEKGDRSSPFNLIPAVLITRPLIK